MIITYIMLAIYILVLLYIGFKDHKTEDSDGFIIADRKVGILGTLASGSASLRDGGGVTLWVGMGFAVGYGLYHFVFALIIAYFLISLFAPKVRKIAKEKNFITVGQMVRSSIGMKSEKAVSALILVASILIVSIQFYVLGNVVSMLLGVNPFNAILVTGLVVAFYVSAGGYKSIVRTDIFQFFIMIGLLIVVLFSPIKLENALDFSAVLDGINTVDYWAAIPYVILIVISGPDIWQRIFSSRDDKSAKHGVRWIGIALLLMTLPLTLLGISARGYIPVDTANNDVFLAIMDSSVYPKFIISYFILVGISITMSTIDTYAYIFSSSLLENFLKIDSSYHKKKYIAYSKVLMIIMLGMAAVLALSISNVVQYMFNAYCLLMVMAPLFLFCVFVKLKRKCAKFDLFCASSILCSFLIGAYMFIQGYMPDFARMLIPAGLSLLFIAMSYVYYRVNDNKKIN